MKYLFLIIALFGAFGLTAQVTDASPIDTAYVLVETGEVESELYSRLNYVTVSGGYITQERTPPELATPFMVRLLADQAQWGQAITNIDAEIAALQEKKAIYEGIKGVIDATITSLE
jgi:hypothetical protein